MGGISLCEPLFFFPLLLET